MKSKARILIPDPLSLAALPSLIAADRVIDTERSILKIYVGKSGLFPAAGHEHWLTAPFAKGSFNDGDFPPLAFQGLRDLHRRLSQCTFNQTGIGSKFFLGWSAPMRS